MTDPKKNRIWDLPVRLFHIAIIILVGLSWYTAENMHVFSFGPQSGPRDFDLHIWSGVSLITLVLFRVLWGFLGSTTARFSYFVKGPANIMRYIRGQGDAGFGHNPLGSLSVLLFLALLLAQPVIGLMSSEDTFGLEGPLKHLVSTETSYWLAEIHEILFNILLAVIALHLMAIAYYRIFKKDNLVPPMVTGGTHKEAPAGLIFQTPWRALLILALAGLIVWSSLTLA
jgi:cytochrome b